MKKNFRPLLYASLSCLILIASGLLYFHTIDRTEAATTGGSSYRKFSGGKITKSPTEKIDEKKSTCESGGICNGTCSNTWADTSSAACGKGTFTLNVYSPKGAETNYCVPSTAKGNGKISSGKLIIDAYTQATPTQIGTCTCISAPPFCAEVTVEQVSVNLGQVTLFGTN